MTDEQQQEQPVMDQPTIDAFDGALGSLRDAIASRSAADIAECARGIVGMAEAFLQKQADAAGPGGSDSPQPDVVQPDTMTDPVDADPMG